MLPNDALRDDAAAGRRRLHIKQSVSQCVKPPRSPAWRSGCASPDRVVGQSLNGIISPSERG